jgi:phosphocarrier protein FPr
VLVLMDLGSAVLSAELAADLLDEERRGKLLLTEAPLVEGAVAAAVAAGLGDPLDAVAAAARAGLDGKAAHLAPGAGGAGQQAGAVEPARTGAAPDPAAQSARLIVRNAHGLHARPAALLVRTAAGFDAVVTVADASNGRGPVGAGSLNGVATLGARQGDELVVTAEGPQAAEALAAIRRLADAGFGELEVAATGAGGAEAGDAGAGELLPARPPAAGAVLAGVPVSPGAAAGPARRLRRRAAVVHDRAAVDPAAEWCALEQALAATAADVRRAGAAVGARAAVADAAIFDAHLLFLEDDALLSPARARVFDHHETAARAWADAISAAAEAWDGLEDTYQRARAADLRDVGEQVLAHLAGPGETAAAAVEAGDVVVAPDLAPADVAALASAAVAGIALAHGGPASHAAILARALGLPAVAGAGVALLAVSDGTPLLVDGDAGAVTVAPSSEAVAAAARRRDLLARAADEARAAASAPAVTRDGVAVSVEANVAGPQDVPAAVAAGADGVGLLRTEYLFLNAAAMPGEDEQAAAYSAVAEALGGRPLTVRTLDAGADKPLAFLAPAPEANPFLGVRGLRLSLARPALLRTQLRAVLRAAAGHDLRVMFPMVATVDELRRAREVLDEARASLRDEGVATPAELEVGVMLEVPSAALIARKLAPLADFFSVGTNDLTQYTLAAERGNAAVASLSDPLHPAVLRLIRLTVEAAAAAGRRVAVCGEVAGDRLAIPLLIGLGVTELSMNAVAIPAAKQAVRATDAARAAGLAEQALDAESAADVRRLLAAAAPSAEPPEDVPSTPPPATHPPSHESES